MMGDSTMGRRQVHKLGGASLADSHCFVRVAELIQKYTDEGDLVVVAAAGKTTNQLLACVANPDQRDGLLNGLQAFQKKLIAELLEGQAEIDLQQALLADVALLRQSLAHSLTQSQLADCVGFGEIWSARLLAALLNQCQCPSHWVDARQFFCAGEGPQPEIDVAISRTNLLPLLQQHTEDRLIITGFIARNHQGQSVTLGRNGSDYSASMLAVLAEAKRMTIWSDVAGVLSADPRQVEGAHSIPLLAMQEANELARLGSPVLHARTLQPLLGTQIRASVRSTFAPEGNHTEMISGQAGDKGAKTVSYLERVSVISLEIGRGGDVEELGEQIFRLLSKHQLMPLAQQVSKDLKSVRLCFTEEVASSAFELLKDYQSGAHLTLDDQHCLLALVGAGVRDNARHYHGFYRCLDTAPVDFVETGPNGVSLVAVLRKTQQLQLSELVVRLHQVIASPDKKLAVVLFGVGNVGQAWLNLFWREQAHLSNYHNMAVQLIGVINEQEAQIDFWGLEQAACESFPEQAEPYEMNELLQQLATHPYDELVMIDASGSPALAELYPKFFAAGCHIVSANKSPASAALSVYQEIIQHQQERARHWFYGSTISACLPITEAIEALHHAGDRVDSIKGVLSGTWSWLLAHYDGQTSFTELLKQAWKKGLTEPDPRDDLTGLDVARKLLILSRKLQLDLEPEQIQCQSLLPPHWQDQTLDACWQDFATLDAIMAQHYQEAARKGEQLCYQAELSRDGCAQVRLISVPQQHVFGYVPEAVTSAAIRSRWYSESPMIIQGPGAGPILAAGAIQMDLFRLCRLIRQV